MNPYVSHLETLPSSFATCDLATQALSPSDLTSSSQQEKEIILCPNHGGEAKVRATQKGEFVWCQAHQRSTYSNKK